MLWISMSYSISNYINSDQIPQILSIHNEARKLVGSPPLTWDTAMEKAQIQCHPTLFQHGQCKKVKGLENVGENIASGGSGVNAAKMFESESKQCNYNSLMTHFDMSQCGGHYSQMVWKTTKSMSCVQVVKNGAIICNYKPAGNWLGASGIAHLPNGSPTTTTKITATQNAKSTPIVRKKHRRKKNRHGRRHY
eukprot:NODE_835_length_3613_cov_0.278600.p2 type:complete len:193 gc:universal NODE_835_length_3613_cov_0.278600:194-772(+)